MTDHARQSAMDEAATELRGRLERERQRINAEICAYPAPIPACDAYFNSLLEERARLNELLGSLPKATVLLEPSDGQADSGARSAQERA